MRLDDIDYIEFLLWKAVGKNWGEWQDSLAGPERHVIEGVGVATAVEQNGGWDDEEGPVHVVVRLDVEYAFPRFFKKSGYYSSYDGTTWDGPFCEVVPVTKTVTAFEVKQA